MTTGNELDALVSAYVDGERLDNAELHRVQAALSSSDQMRRDVSLQHATRSLVRERAGRLRNQPPAHLRASISAALDAVDASPAVSAPASSWSFAEAIRSLFATPALVRGLVAVGSVAVIALVALVVLREPSQVTTEVSSVAYASFGSVVDGSFPIERSSSNESELRAFFADKGVEFPVFFPQLDASLRGGSVVTINGRQCVQLVYSAGSTPIYLLETDNADITGGRVELAKEILDDVEQSRWHWEERADVGTMFVWKSNNVMCTAVSTLPTNEFSALFRLETL